jgi:hypothetical protein
VQLLPRLLPLWQYIAPKSTVHTSAVPLRVVSSNVNRVSAPGAHDHPLHAISTPNPLACCTVDVVAHHPVTQPARHLTLTTHNTPHHPLTQCTCCLTLAAHENTTLSKLCYKPFQAVPKGQTRNPITVTQKSTSSQRKKSTWIPAENKASIKLHM